MPRKKLTNADIDEMAKAYVDWDPWDPGAISADELAEQFGTSRSTMYRWLKVRAIPLKEGQQSELQPRASMSGMVPKEVFLDAVEQIVELRIRIATLEAELKRHH